MDINACHIHRLVADVALLADRQVLFVRYRDTTRYDHQEGWFLPDDYLNPFEHPDEAAVRILRDQVGLTVSATRLDHIESFGTRATACPYRESGRRALVPARCAPRAR